MVCRSQHMRHGSPWPFLLFCSVSVSEVIYLWPSCWWEPRAGPRRKTAALGSNSEAWAQPPGHSKDIEAGSKTGPRTQGG